MLSFDLSGKGGPTSSYDTAGIALWIIAPRKPPYQPKDAFVKVEILQGGLKLVPVLNQVLQHVSFHVYHIQGEYSAGYGKPIATAKPLFIGSLVCSSFLAEVGGI